MSSITSTGMGSGLNINDIVKSIVGAEKDPALAKMIKAEGEATAIISAYGLLNSELSGFKSSYKELGRSSTFAAATATSSDSDILDAKLGIGAATGQWEFEVKQRAQAQTLVSSKANGFSAVTDPVGEGTLVLQFGSYNKDANGKFIGDTFTIDDNHPIEKITIDNTVDPKTGVSNNSLAGMRDTINNGDYSVSASIINDGENYRLVLTNKETGEENAVQMIAQDKEGTDGVPITGGTGLDRFNFSASEQKMTQTSQAQDANIVMNGISITRDTNEVSSVIEGVTLNLNSAEVDKKVTLTINQDTSKVEEQVRAFVENYNSTIAKMNELTAYNGSGTKSGVLNGDSTVRNIQNLMRGSLNTIVENIDGSIHSFADIGILTNRDGSLSFDGKDKDGISIFPDILKKDMAGVANFFTASGAASDQFISFESNNSLTKPGTYGIEVTQLATQGNLNGSDISASFPLTIGANNDSFKIRVDGFESTGTKENPGITLTQGNYASIDDLATELQSKINSDPNFVKNGINVSVIEDAGKLSIVSNKYGSSSTVAFMASDPVTEADFISNLGFSGASSINGLNVEGKIDGKEALGDGQFLLSETGDSTGIKVLIDGGVLGKRGDVTYAEGMTTVMNDMLTGIIDRNISGSDGDVGSSNGIIDGKIDSLYKKNTDIANQKESLAYRMEKMEKRLFKQFNAMDMAVSNMNNTMAYLKSSLDALPGYTRDK